jgi:hypothetical protein
LISRSRESRKPARHEAAGFSFGHLPACVPDVVPAHRSGLQPTLAVATTFAVEPSQQHAVLDESVQSRLPDSAKL